MHHNSVHTQAIVGLEIQLTERTVERLCEFGSGSCCHGLFYVILSSGNRMFPKINEYPTTCFGLNPLVLIKLDTKFYLPLTSILPIFPTTNMSWATMPSTTHYFQKYFDIGKSEVVY